MIELLQDIPADAQVAFASDYGDHCHTEQVHTLRGEVEERALYESAYSDSGFAVIKDEDDKRTETAPKIFILS